MEKRLEELVGPTTAGHIHGWAGAFVRSARIKRGLTQRELAQAAGVPASTIARIETSKMQPTFPMLAKILAAAGLELRARLADLDTHDRILDHRDALDPQGAHERAEGLDRLFGKAENV